MKFLHKMWAWSGAFLLLFASLACGLTPSLPTATPTESPSPTATNLPTLTLVPLFQSVSMVSITKNETVDKPAYTLKAEIPRLQGSEDARVKNFNDEMTQLTQEEVAKFMDNVVQVQPIPGAGGSFYDQQFKVFTPQGNLISLRFQIMIYISGAAHPGSHSRTVTYDLEAGKDIKLAGLFLLGSDYLKTIANYCVVQLQERNIGFGSSSRGAEATPENYGNWNITQDGLLITFDEYQVAAYAAGAQEVVVPFTELQPIVDPHGPLQTYLP